MSSSIWRQILSLKFLKNFILLFLSIGAISFTIFFLSDRTISREQLTSLKAEERQLVRLIAENTGSDINQVIRVLLYIYDQDNLLLESGDFRRVTEEWINISNNFKIFDQIRFINTEGDEVIRINNQQTGAISSKSEDLQNKKDRYYFIETMQLPKMHLFLSPLDLNVENKQVEIPYKPMIRLSIPVYGSDNEIDGMIILNYLAENLLTKIQEYAVNDTEDIFLLNQNGYWLSSGNPDEEWGFMFEDKKDVRFDIRYPQEWQKMINGETEFITDNGLFSVSSPLIWDQFSDNPQDISMSQLHVGEPQWLIVSYAQADGEHANLFNPGLFNFFNNNFLFYLFFYSTLVLLSFAGATLITYRQYMTNSIRFFSERDALTNVYNRKGGIEKLRKYLPGSNNRKTNLAICFTDINGLKQVNDSLGHKAGDELIRSYTAVIVDAIREDDFVFRLGGDEFVIVLKNADQSIAEKTWQRIVSKFDQINQTPGRKYLISGSHGIVSTESELSGSIEEILALADTKMYTEKREIKQNFKAIL
jgi:diguanylate cyclase (GGDEF)-like protein